MEVYRQAWSVNRALFYPYYLLLSALSLWALSAEVCSLLYFYWRWPDYGNLSAAEQTQQQQVETRDHKP